MLGLTRRLLSNKPKKTDSTLLAQFYYADVDLCNVAAELDSFDGRKNPARCAALVAQLRQYQDHVLRLMQNMMDEVIKDQRASRDFRIKYPEDLIQDGLAGQLWFGAECLAAGSSILNREIESESMRPLAKSLTKQLDHLRHILRDQSTRDPLTYTDRIKSAFVKFDQTFAEFELSYVSAMVPVKTMKEYDMSQEVTVLFSETVHRALAHGLITGDMLEYYDPELMFTIPRLAIVSGLVFFPEGPLNPDRKSQDMSELFRPFQSLLKRIRELLWTLNQEELRYLERLLCNLEQTLGNDVIQASHSTQKKTDNEEPSSTYRTSAAASSLFHDISNLQDSVESAEMDNAAGIRTDTDDFRTALLDVLAGSSSDQGNNNLSQTGVDHDTSNGPSTRYYQTVPSSGVIINDTETGVARLIISSSAQQNGFTESDEVLPCGQPSVVPHSRPLRAKRQPSAGSTSSQHSTQFAFNLPHTSRTTEASDQSSDDDINSSNVADGNISEPTRVTVNRTASQDQTGARVVLDEESEDVQSDSDSSSDSSISQISPSEGESSSSSRGASPNAGRKQLLVQPFLDEKSQNLRRRYQNAQELLQKLFICISGVADQLQSNFACDLRNILKCVFELHTSDGNPVSDTQKNNSPTIRVTQQSPPTWMPDSEMDKCCSCRLPFTLIRRRHHCRNCGLIFCGRCSSNTAPLPNYGYDRAVRICNKCYVYRINPFFMDDNEEEPYNSASSRQQT